MGDGEIHRSSEGPEPMSEPDPYQQPQQYPQYQQYPQPQQSPGPYPPPWGTELQPYSSGAPAVYQQPAMGYQQYPAASNLVSPGGRFGAACLDFLLIMVTFGLGWLIWACVTWSNGQSPAKSLLGHVVADAQTGQAFDWGRMFLREFVIRGLLFGLVNTITLGVFGLVDAFMVFGTTRRTLHDQMAGSIVRLV
jgi:hypothetical protein